MNGGIIVASKRDYSGETTTDDFDLPLFDFTTLVIATKNFSNANKLGQGGFGCVYKVNVICIVKAYYISYVIHHLSVENKK